MYKYCIGSTNPKLKSLKQKFPGAVRVLLALIISALLISTGCSNTTSSGSTPTGTVKTLKMGFIGTLNDLMSYSGSRAIEALVEADNKSGGIKVGADTYKIDLIVYDSKGSQDQATAAANRLMYEDNVKFIMMDTTFLSAVVPLTEANKVMLTGLYTGDPSIFAPTNHYSFNPCAVISEGNALTGWYAENNPGKKVLAVFPDNNPGHGTAMGVGAAMKALGINPEIIFFPPSSQDLSSIGTQIKTTNPDVVALPPSSWPAVKAAWDSGYTGTFLEIDSAPAANLTENFNNDALSHWISIGDPTEFDPPLNQMAKDLKAAYIAKFGKWDYPGIEMTSLYYSIKAALQKAGSLDTTMVADILGNGFSFDSAVGLTQMVSRPDMGNSRTVDAVNSVTIKKIVNGKPEVFYTIPIDKSIEYNKIVTSQPMAPPGGGGPPGGPPGAGGPPGGAPPPGFSGPPPQ